MKVRGTTINTPLARHAVTDDTCVSKNAWSSKNTVDMLCPSFKTNGAIVACEPVEGYPLSVTASEDATKITRCGKNLFDKSRKVTQLTYTNADGTESTRWGVAFYLPAGKYTLHADKITTNTSDKWIYCGAIDANGYYQKPANYDNNYVWFGQKSYTKTIELNEGEVMIVYNGSQVGTESASQNLLTSHFNIQIEVGEVKTDWELYVGGEFAVGEEIPALAGVNTLWADSGEIEVNGRADVKAIIEKLTNATLALGSNV